MKKLFLITLFLVSASSYAQINFSPSPVNGEINLNTAGSIIYISNTANDPLNLNLTVSPIIGITKGIDRCSGKTLAKGQSCYFVINTNDSLLSQLENIADLKNNGVSVLSLKRNKIQSLGSSLFTQSSLSLNDFSAKNITIQNKTATTKTYNPVISGADSSKYEIILNRCSNVLSGKTCSISVKLKPQSEGNFSASITETQISGSVSLSSSITNTTSGVIIPLVESISVSPSSLNFGDLTSFGNSTGKSITISNTGTSVVTPVISLSSNMSILMNRCSSSLKVGDSCSISVGLKSTVSDFNGPMSGSVSIKASLNSSPYVVSTTGNLNVPPAYITGTSQGGTCPSGFHFEGAACVSDTRACAPSSFTSSIIGGIQNWISNSWSSCIPQQASHCANGYVYSSNQCNLPPAYIVDYLSSKNNTSLFSAYDIHYSQFTDYLELVLNQRTKIDSIEFLITQYSSSGSLSMRLLNGIANTLTWEQNLGPLTPYIIANSSSVNISSLTFNSSFPSVPTNISGYALAKFDFSNVTLEPGTYYFSINKSNWSGSRIFVATSVSNPTSNYFTWTYSNGWVFLAFNQRFVYRIKGNPVP